MRADEQKPDKRRERWASGLVIAKPISIKDAERRSGGGAPKAVELTSGDLLGVPQGGTEDIARCSDPQAEVSRGHITHDS